MDTNETLGQQKEKLNKAMESITASFKQHLIDQGINNADTLDEVRAYALNKFQDIRRLLITEANLAAAREERPSLKRKATDNAPKTLNKASRVSTSTHQISTSASINNRQHAVPKRVCRKRLPKTLDEVLKVGSGPDIDLWVFKAQLEQKFGFGNDAALTRMQKKTQEYLIAGLMKHKLASTQGHLVDFSECTFIVDAMPTQDQFRDD
ncbi:hypothetical protein C8J56DRAFT_900292 [Mycena floridula]|nr:hypothetical protein C8J56DRAFT_900292 [Mycena floridula]